MVKSQLSSISSPILCSRQLQYVNEVPPPGILVDDHPFNELPPTTPRILTHPDLESPGTPPHTEECLDGDALNRLFSDGE